MAFASNLQKGEIAVFYRYPYGFFLGLDCLFLAIDSSFTLKPRAFSLDGRDVAGGVVASSNDDNDEDLPELIPLDEPLGCRCSICTIRPSLVRARL
ncbi:hypothetical protein B0H11DRAFT_2215081 [Mycena galericulata]|nr:hypothetical protein B0H11DRAFT_2215081 [Mycena galericulata]